MLVIFQDNTMANPDLHYQLSVVFQVIRKLLGEFFKNLFSGLINSQEYLGCVKTYLTVTLRHAYGINALFRGDCPLYYLAWLQKEMQ